MKLEWSIETCQLVVEEKDHDDDVADVALKDFW